MPFSLDLLPLDLLVPTPAALIGWGGAIFAALVLMGLGRLVSRGAARPEAALVAGWGAAALVLTLWGVATPASMRIPAIGIAIAGAAAFVLPRARLSRAEGLGLLRILALSLPLLAVMASARPAEPDTFLNLLPNAAYLYDHASFPAAGRPDAHSYLPAAPYNLQFAALLAGLVTRDFPANALIAFNILLQLGAGLFLARLAASREDGDAAPGWGACALGLLLATALNVGFVPRFHFSSYSEPGVTVALLFAAWFAARTVQAPAATPALLLSLSLAALVEIKQDSIALVLAVLATAALLALTRPARGRTLTALAAAAVPALVLALAWRWFVLSHLPGGEIAPLPPAQWQISEIGQILASMAGIIAGKGVFYLVLFGTIALTLWRVRRRGLDVAGRMGALLAGCYLLYSAALVFAYVALFPGTMGTDAHSYFRYSTHLSLLLMAVLVLLLRDAAQRYAMRRHSAAALAIVLILASPVAFLPYLRFDLDPPTLRAAWLAENVAPRLAGRERVALLLPGDNGSVAAALGTLLRNAPPRHPALDLSAVTELTPDIMDRLTAQGYSVAIISCAPSGFTAAPPGSAALLEHDGRGWRPALLLHYPPPRGFRWHHVLSYAPLCLE
jgi:hypothetical protein